MCNLYYFNFYNIYAPMIVNKECISDHSLTLHDLKVQIRKDNAVFLLWIDAKKDYLIKHIQKHEKSFIIFYNYEFNKCYLLIVYINTDKTPQNFDRNNIIFLILHRTRWKSNWSRGKLKKVEFINDFVIKLGS